MKPGTRLKIVVEEAFPKLISIDDEFTSTVPEPGKWSPKQIIGHLLDSASNNHQRFMRAQFQNSLVFDGYDQEEWVEKQNYQDADWRDLVLFWKIFNDRLGDLIDNIPAETMKLQRKEHNLNEIAWKTVPADSPTTLEYFVNDYIDHLEHHLDQIFEQLSP